jgi:hypothetical protein
MLPSFAISRSTPASDGVRRNANICRRRRVIAGAVVDDQLGPSWPRTSCRTRTALNTEMTRNVSSSRGNCAEDVQSCAARRCWREALDARPVRCSLPSAGRRASFEYDGTATTTSGPSADRWQLLVRQGSCASLSAHAAVAPSSRVETGLRDVVIVVSNAECPADHVADPGSCPDAAGVARRLRGRSMSRVSTRALTAAREVIGVPRRGTR